MSVKTSTSLVQPNAATAAARRFRAAVDVDSSPDLSPTLPTDGVACRGCRFLHVVIEIVDSGDGCDWELWCYDGVSEKWYLDTRLGTDGTVTLDPSDADYPVFGNILEFSGTVERVFVKLDNATGSTWTGGVNVWVSSVGEVEG